MMKKTVMAIISLFFLILLGGFLGGRINTSKSIPVGLYWITERKININEYVIFCPPPTMVFHEAKRRGYVGTGFCPGRYGYMMKKVLAAKGNIVSISEKGVYVDGEFIPLSIPFLQDGLGRDLPQMRLNNFHVGEGEVLLMSDVSSTSFDARYFGLINASQIQAVIEPVFTW